MSAQAPTIASDENQIGALPLWLVPLLALLILHIGQILLHPILGGEIFDVDSDPDSLMRLARIRYVLATHSWHGGFFPRENAPYGTVLHWTMLFDLPIIALTALASLLIPFERALHLAGTLTGPIFDYGVLLAAWWVPAPVLTPAARQFACYVVLLSPSLLAYSAVGRANYHVALVLLALVLAGFVVRVWHNPKRIWPAVAGGITAGFCLWLSPELLVVGVIPAILTLALLWVRDGDERLAQNFAFAVAFAALITAALLIDPPYAGLRAVEVDRLSVPYECLSVLIALAWIALWLLPSANARNVPRRLFSGLAIAICAVGIWLAFYPEVVAGPMGQIDPLVRTELSPRTPEFQPATISVPIFIVMTFTGWLGIAAIVALFWCDRSRPTRLSWLVLAALTIPLMYLTIAHYRFTHYSSVAVAFPIAALMERLQEWLNARQSSFASYLRASALFICAVPFLSIIFIPDKEIAANPVAIKCSISAVREPLDDVAWFGKASGIIATESISAPAVLYWTRHSTVFGPYHRNAQGLRDHIDLFGDEDDETARAIVRARGIDALLICGGQRGGARPPEASPEDLYRRLVEGRAPDWLRLKPWPEKIHSDYRLYMVDRERLEAPIVKPRDAARGG